MKTENVKSYQDYGSYDSVSVCGSDRKSSMSDPEYDRKSSMSDPEFDPLSDEDEDDVYKCDGLEDSEINELADQMTGIKLVPRAPMKHIDNYRDNLRNSTVPWAVQTQNTVTPSGGRVLNNFAQSILTTNLRNQNNRPSANGHVQNIMTTNLQSQSVRTHNVHPQNVMTTNLQSQNGVTANLTSPSVLTTNVQNRNIPNTAAQNENVLTTSLSAYPNTIYNNNNNGSPPSNVYQLFCPVGDDELENEIKRLIESPHKEDNLRTLQAECNSISYLPLSIPLGTDTLPQLSNNDLDEILGIEFFNSDDDDDDTQNDSAHSSLGIIDGNADRNDYSAPLSVGLTIIPPSVTSSNCSSPVNVDYLLPASAASPAVQCTHVSAALSPNLNFLDSSATSAHYTDLSTHLLRPIAVSSTGSPVNISPHTRTANICNADVHSIISSLSAHSSFHEVRQPRTSISTNSTPSHPGSSEYSPVSEPQHSPYSSTPDLYQRFSPNIIDAHDTIIPLTVNEDTGDADDSSRSSSSRKSSNQENVSAKDRLQQKFLAEPHLRQEKKKAYLQANLRSAEQLLTYIQSLAKCTDANVEVKLYANMEVFVYNASREQITTLFRTARFLHWSSVKNNALLSGYVREVMLDHDIEPETSKDYPRIINGAW